MGIVIVGFADRQLRRVIEADNRTVDRVWTLADIRHDLAEELRIVHRAMQSHRRLLPIGTRSYFLEGIVNEIIELGHNRYERPERLDRLHHGAYFGPQGGRQV